MSDLFNIGASGVRAYQSALSTIGQNVANAETAGYVRRDVRLNEAGAGAADPYHQSRGSGSGVTVAGVVRAWDAFRASDARLSAADAARAATRAEWMENAEAGFDDSDAGVGARLGTFFNSATALAANPDGALPRQQMIGALGDAAAKIVQSATSLQRVSDGIAADAGAAAQGINDDLTALAKVNAALGRTPAASAATLTLLDERDRLLDGLSAKIGSEATIDARGAATVTAGGAVLLDGEGAKAVGITRSADGRIGVTLTGSATAIAPTGGGMAGLIDAAAAVATSRTKLDTIATSFRDQVNGWNAQGTTSAGAPGGALLAGTGAATLALAAGIDGSAIATRGADGSANGNLAALSSLRGADGAENRVDTLILFNAQALASTKAEAAAANTRSDAAFAARDAVSAVDLDREAAELLRFQQAYDASARVLQVARESVQSILQLF